MCEQRPPPRHPILTRLPLSSICTYDFYHLPHVDIFKTYVYPCNIPTSSRGPPTQLLSAVFLVYDKLDSYIWYMTHAVVSTASVFVECSHLSPGFGHCDHWQEQTRWRWVLVPLLLEQQRLLVEDSCLRDFQGMPVTDQRSSFGPPSRDFSRFNTCLIHFGIKRPGKLSGWFFWTWPLVLDVPFSSAPAHIRRPN